MPAATIIETSSNRFYRVSETGDAAMDHVWFGIEVKRFEGGWVPKANARPEMVRRAATRAVEVV